MKYTYAEITRLVSYVAGILVGLGFVTYGLVNGDLTTAAAGAGMLGLGGLAGYNTPKTEAPVVTGDGEVAEVELGDEVDYVFTSEPSEFEEGQITPTAAVDPADLAKHAE